MAEFTPARVGTTEPVSVAQRPLGPAPTVSDKAPPPDPLAEIARMAEELAQTTAHIATMIPSLAPLMASANRMRLQAARIRLVLEPAPVEGPQPDHSP